MKKALLIAVFSTALLTACTSPEGVQSSGIESPSVWSRLTQSDNADAPLVLDEKAEVQQAWWTNFNDPTLDAILKEGLANNKTLGIAKARVEEARAARIVARSALLPQLEITAGSSRGNQGFASNDRAVTINEASLEASWELDLFGKNQARTRSAAAIVESEEANRQATTVALLAEIARNYFDLRNYQQQIAITQKNLDNQKKTLDIINVQLEGALVSDFDVQRTAAQVSTTESQLPSLQIAYDMTLNRLNVLLGHVPGTKDALLAEPQELPPVPQQVVVSAPATVLANRPDIRAAERRFTASIADKSAATAELFPNISLLGFFGVQDTSVLSASPWGIAANLAQPVLNFGRITSQIDAADARQQQAFLAYQQTVLEGLEDMENALSNYGNETNRHAALARAVEQNTKSTALAREQYTSGYNGLLDVLVTERDVLDAESNFAASDAKLRKDLVNIYTAAGGGWDIE